MTVGELKFYLSKFDEDQPLALSFIDGREEDNDSQCTKIVWVDAIKEDYARYLRDTYKRDVPDNLVILSGSLNKEEDIVWDEENKKVELISTTLLDGEEDDV